MMFKNQNPNREAASYALVASSADSNCSVAAGRFTSGLLSITIIVSLGAFIQAIVLCLLLLNYSGLLSTLYLLLIGGMWGIGNGVLNTQLCAFLGILFKHDLEGAFAQLNLWQSISIAVVYFLSPYISFETMIVIMLTALCISILGFLFLTLQIEKVFSRHAF
ncbi:UNC93 3 [Olea europaea subsp. europaea]|uniref:UNC93 3 n=1 Tax=Olea europaea subsp. europaea TaxID=158383 RepID=A0A8S0TDC5_OLEEU|nr:UNC93 3 [Olea europaea subsp. europaea]